MIYDVIFWDTVGTPYNGDTPSKQAMGGSEHQVILLAEALVKKNKKVAILNTVSFGRSTIQTNDVMYGSSGAEPSALNCETLVICRYSKMPAKINYRKVLVWCTDNYDADAYEHHQEIPFIFVSNWQSKQWGLYNDLKDFVIPNMLPDFGPVTPITHSDDYVYASSDINNRLFHTLDEWIKRRLDRPSSTLHVYTPGYEGDTNSILDLERNFKEWKKDGVIFHGPKPYNKVVEAIRNSAGLFMVNTVTETFCIVAAMAEALGRQVNMLCLNGFGAVVETVNSPLVTDDVKQFATNFREKADASYYRDPKDYSEETIVSKWLKLLAPQEPAVRYGTEHPKIILNMIVKNEAHVIERCLNSVRHLIDGWVIVDTGSTDGTQEIISKFLSNRLGSLRERPWVHFAHNRSEAIIEAEQFVSQHRMGDSYLLLIDADDIYQGELNSSSLSADVYTVNISDDDGRMLYRRQQLFRVGKGFRFEGVRHEYPTTDQPRIEAHLDTLTYVRLGGGARAKDPDTLIKDAMALKRELDKHPKDTRTAYYLAQSWKDCGEYQMAKAAYDHRISLPNGFHEEAYISMLFAGRISKGLKESPVKYWTDAYNLCPERAEAQYELALYYREQKQMHVAVIWAMAGVAVDLPADGLFIEKEIYTWKVAEELAVALTWTGDKHLEVALDMFKQLLTKAPASEHERIQKSIGHCKERLSK